MMLSSQCVVFEHPDFWVTYKPAGLDFHQDQVGNPGFVAQFRDLVGADAVYPIHRLDRVTSGLLILARHPAAAQQFGALFASSQMQKFYLALSDRPPLKKQGTVQGYMQSGRSGSWRLSRQPSTETERWAKTQFFSQGLGRVEVAEAGESKTLRLFLLRPLTGRTHQLRVALKSLGAPILGDQRYGGSPADRAYLHAFDLTFPWAGEICHFQVSPREGLWFAHPACSQGQGHYELPEQLHWPAH